MHAYDEIYVAKAQTALGQMLRYAVEDCRCDLNEFWDMFLISGVADMFGSGDFTKQVLYRNKCHTAPF